MTEDFEPGSKGNKEGHTKGDPSKMFGCDFAEGETNPFKAKKSKSKFVPDPNKC